MSKTLRIALREFLATVKTAGFLIGMLVTPAMLAVALLVFPRLMTKPAPRVVGQVAIVDPTGAVADGLRAYLAPEAMAARRGEIAREIDRRMPSPFRAGAPLAKDIAHTAALDAILGQVPKLEVVALPADADLEREKEPLRQDEGQGGGRLMLLVIDANAITPTSGSKEYGSYDLFARGKLDDRIEEEVASGLREAIVTARVRAAGLDRQRIEAVTRVARRASVTVTKEGDRQTNKVFNMLLPGGFMVLLLMSVMIGGQNLLTTTVEEKSNRVVEILLSAVSPMQLMTGKILGHLAVGLVVLLLYGGMGIAALVSFSLMGLLDATLIVYLVIFFLIAYFVVAAFMAAVGAAVNEMREAQTLMMPVMLLLMIPWFLWMPISRDPNGALAVTLSFLPPANSFAMLLRLTSATPPPAWQAWLSIAIGLASVYAALWAAAKVFRIGLLLYGKPPNLATLVRWIRMA